MLLGHLTKVSDMRHKMPLPSFGASRGYRRSPEESLRMGQHPREEDDAVEIYVVILAGKRWAQAELLR
jgi:hypothetical protein